MIPKVMGSALRLHPLLVIFGLLAGGEIYGLPGVLVALPLLAAGRAAWEFFGERVSLEPWEAGQPLPVEVAVEAPPRVKVDMDAPRPVVVEVEERPAAQQPVRDRGPGEGVTRPGGQREVPPTSRESDQTEGAPEPPAAVSG